MTRPRRPFGANHPGRLPATMMKVLAAEMSDPSRLRRGKNPMTTPGKDHISHRLVALGLTRREAVLTCYLVGGVCGMVAVFVSQASMPDGYVATGLLAFSGVASIAWFEWRVPTGA